MTLIELICLASAGYEKEFPESPLTEQCHPDGQPWSSEEHQSNPTGDLLGRFIVVELAETFDASTTDEEQIEEAVRALARARHELDSVIASLSNFETDSTGQPAR